MSGHRISSSKLPFSSLDPPDVKRNLPAPFKPTHKVLKDEDILRTAQTPPFETLPCILIPSSKMGLKPPVMHYGWRVNRAKLLKYAETMALFGIRIMKAQHRWKRCQQKKRPADCGRTSQAACTMHCEAWLRSSD
ncbi:hypothetical protein AcV5_001718 [Taiwanofungus camphoratus]|nr:hypothetical protein AcV5_001718 [Antrodia cinnamomea]